MEYTLDDLVQKYVECRDKKAALKAEYEEKASKFDAVMDKIETTLLKNFEANGTESIRTPHGTAYKSTRTTATVADWDIALDFIRENEAWEMLERRVNKKAVEEHINEHEVPPPGVNIRQETTINIRRT
jgi:hypothetical protein